VRGFFVGIIIIMPKIPTSILNESVTIQTLSGSSVDDRGLSTATFSDSATSVQCKIQHTRAQELTTDGRTEENDIFVVTMGPNETITPQDRIEWESNYYDIKAVKNVKDRFGNVFYKEIEMQAGF